MANIEPFNTGLTEEQLSEAFSRALNDMTDEQINALLAAKANAADLSTVATSGSYADLINKPEIDAAPTESSTRAVQSGGVFAALAAKAAVGDIYGSGTILSATSSSRVDLNDIVDVGRYQCGLSVSEYIDNLPNVGSNYGFALTVMTNGLASRIRQQLTFNYLDLTGIIFERYKTGTSTWSRWYKYSADINPVHGGTYYALGDSIVDYQGTTADPKYQTSGTSILGYIQAIERKYNVTCTNHGNAGHTILDDLTALLALDYSSVDIVTIGYGVNDARLNETLGTKTDTGTTTFAGGLNNLLQKIFGDNPNCRVIVLTPIQRDYINSFGSFTPNQNGDTLEDFVEMCKAVAGMNATPCIDLFHSCGINSATYDALLRDGVHPKNSGYKRMWQVMKPAIDGLVTGEFSYS